MAGAVKLIVAWPLPATTPVMTGTPGTVIGAEGVTALDGEEGGLLPMALVATTVKV